MHTHTESLDYIRTRCVHTTNGTRPRSIRTHVARNETPACACAYACLVYVEHPTAPSCQRIIYDSLIVRRRYRRGRWCVHIYIYIYTSYIYIYIYTYTRVSEYSMRVRSPSREDASRRCESRTCELSRRSRRSRANARGDSGVCSSSRSLFSLDSSPDFVSTYLMRSHPLPFSEDGHQVSAARGDSSERPLFEAVQKKKKKKRKRKKERKKSKETEMRIESKLFTHPNV